MKRKPGSNNGIVKCLGALFCVAGGAFVAGVGATTAMAVRNTKKMKQHENENNYMMACLFQKEEIGIKPDLQNVYITVLCGKAHITVPRPENDRMNIDITSAAGNITIDLPDDVTVRCDGAKYADFSKEGAEECPVVNLVINDYASSLTLNFV